jgi:hypothetical protein
MDVAFPSGDQVAIADARREKRIGFRPEISSTSLNFPKGENHD